MKITIYELWKDIKDFEGLYQISNLGNIKSLPKKHNLKNGHSYIQKEQILKPFKNNKGYLQIALVKNGKHYKRQVHNLVATAFIENPNNYIEINHKDENPSNNEVEIIEEDKKIEKLELYEDSDGHYFYDKHCKKIYITCDEINFMFEQFNELIDEINNLKEK